MANNDENFSSKQPDLFQQLGNHEPEYLSDNAPDLDIEQEFMGQIKFVLRTAKKRGLTRERIVDRMNLCLPDALQVTKRQLDSWCAESKEYHLFPAIYLPAFIWSVRGVITPLEVLTSVLGLVVLDEHEQLAAELGRSVLTKVQASNIERRIKKKFQLDQ